MPKAGYTSWTVSTKLAAYCRAIYDANSPSLRKEGMTSFSGFVEKAIHAYIDCNLKEKKDFVMPDAWKNREVDKKC